MGLLSRLLAIGLGRTGKMWTNDMYAASKRQIFDAGSRNKVRGPAVAVRCELRDAGRQWPAWDTLAAGEKLLDWRDTAPSDIHKYSC